MSDQRYRYEVAVIGGGFAGRQAVAALLHRDARVTLYDPRAGLEFLPLLPDIIGRSLHPDALRSDHPRHERLAVKAESVLEVDADEGWVATAAGKYEYDAVVVSVGSQTLAPPDSIGEHGLPMDSIKDTCRIRQGLQQPDLRHVVVAGGGYAGVEAASVIQRMLDRYGRTEVGVHIAEKGPRLMRVFPDDLAQYAMDNLERMGIAFNTGCTVAEADGDNVVLSDGRCFHKALLVWTAGRVAADRPHVHGVERVERNRWTVDSCLQTGARCFAAGDAAATPGPEGLLRMGVQFSRVTGNLAGRNTLRLLQGRTLHECHPVDPGYLVPMANFRSCGVILRLPLKGRIPTLLHYGMSLLRMPGCRARARLIRELAGSFRPDSA